MYHVECIDIHKGDPLFLLLDRSSLCANNMYNVSNFYIRNLMTGLKKALPERTANESLVIETVASSIPGINESLRQKYDRKVEKIRNDKRLTEQERNAAVSKVKCRQFVTPSAEKWFASYGLLDAVFKYTGNQDYRSFHAHIIQNAIKDCCEAWKGYFESLKSYVPSSGHTGKPKIPGYRKSGGRSTAVFSNLACGIKHGRLFFPYCAEGDTPGKVRRSLDVSGLPHASKDKLVEVRAVPYFGMYQLQVVTDDGVPEEGLLPDEKDIIGADGKPAGAV